MTATDDLRSIRRDLDALTTNVVHRGHNTTAHQAVIHALAQPHDGPPKPEYTRALADCARAARRAVRAAKNILGAA